MTHTQTHDAPASYAVRLVIAWRYGYHACNYGRLGALVWALTDPIARLNPIYCKASYASDMLRRTASALLRARMAKRRARRRGR